MQEEPRKQRKVDISQHKRRLESLRGVYSDPIVAWNKWIDESRDSITPENAEEMWGMAEQEFPGSVDESKNMLRSKFRDNLPSEPVARESDLRNRMQTAPSWMQEEFAPEMASVSNKVSVQNMAKSKSIYSMALEQKLAKLDLTQLDLDVPMDVHLQEIVALEAMNMLDMAQIVNGRFCIANERGQVEPAFNLLSKPDVQQLLATDSPELNMVREIATRIIKPALSEAVATSRDLGSIENKAAGGAAIQALKSGNVPIDQWGDMMSMVDGNGVSAGMDGIAKKNPFMSQNDIAATSIDIANRYGGPTNGTY